MWPAHAAEDSRKSRLSVRFVLEKKSLLCPTISPYGTHYLPPFACHDNTNEWAIPRREAPQ